MNKENLKQKGQVIYFSHGGGPLPILGDSSHEKMNEFMKSLPKKVRRPDAIVVISAHWEEDIVTIQSGKGPDIKYDYYGFPEAAYNIKYPCLGDSNLALEIGELFNENNIDYLLDDKRPYDHGVYIPLKMMYPNADIPVLQISLNHNLDPLTHLNMGKALKPLLKKNILVIGSGFSFHNMKAFDFNGNNIEDNRNNNFQDKLIEVCCDEKKYEEMWEQLINWEKFPSARYCHPREEHLLPLVFCAGLSKKTAVKVFDDYILGKRATAFLWK
jgi:aromatic ring-opening dioxygenase catalytic subunit (LigB family)